MLTAQSLDMTHTYALSVLFSVIQAAWNFPYEETHTL